MPPRPNPPRQRQKLGCWATGFLGCLVVFVFLAVLVASSVYKLGHTASGRGFAHDLGNAVRLGEQEGDCVQAMTATREAVIRYHDHTGHYPPTLAALVPVYLASTSAMHCKLDSDTDPAHVTFAYTRPPSDDTPETAPDPLLSMHWSYTLQIDGQSATTDNELVMLLNGTPITNQSRATTTTTTTTAKGAATPASGSAAPVSAKPIVGK